MTIGIELSKIIKDFSPLYCRENDREKIVYDGKKIIPRIANTVEYFAPHLYTYHINKYGFRSIEFSSDTNILTAGCSFTFGTGIPFEYTWSQQLQKMLPNKKIATIAWPGLSIEVIISYIFKYFKEIGNPEMIICNFPDFFRFQFFEEFSKKIIPVYSNILNNIFFSKEQKKMMEKKLYHPLWGFYTNFEHLMMLEQYCESSGIKLIFSTWATSQASYYNNNYKYFYDIENFYKELNIKNIFEVLKNNFKYFYNSYEDLYFDCIHSNCTWDKDGNFYMLENTDIKNKDFEYLFDCHRELKNKTKDFFEIAYDRYIVPEKHIHNYEDHICIDDSEKNKNLNINFSGLQSGGHWGSHRNAHVAEFYFNIIKEKYPDFI